MNVLMNWCTFFVFNSVWQILVLIAIVALLLRVLPKLSNALQYRLWVSCLLLGVVVPLVSTYLAVVPVHTFEAMDREAGINRWKTPRSPEHGRLTLPLTAVSTAHLEWSPFRIVAGSYIISLLFGAGLLLVRLEKTRRIIESRIPVAADLPGTMVLHDELKTNSPAIGIFATRELDAPATVNWPEPVILLPLVFECMDRQEQAAVMAHELAHVERKDFLKNLLLEVLSLSLCYHPAIPWLKKRIAECREAICDEMAAEATSGRTTYAHSLLNVAQMTASQGRLRAGLTLGIANTELERRIMKLVQVPLVVSHGRKLLLQGLCLSVLAFASVGVLCFSLHPTSCKRLGSQHFLSIPPKHSTR